MVNKVRSFKSFSEANQLIEFSKNTKELFEYTILIKSNIEIYLLIFKSLYFLYLLQ